MALIAFGSKAMQPTVATVGALARDIWSRRKANLKLASVLTDIMGLSGRAILDAQVAGETDPERLLALVHRRVKAEPAQLRAALSGRVGNSHRFLLRLHLGQYDALAKALEEIDAEVELNLDPFRDAVRLLRTVPGIGDLAARAIVAEIGSDMRRFPTAAHLVSWAGLCPRNDESAGKRRSTRLRKGAPWLKTALVQCAWAASRKKDGYLRAQFQRLRQRRGPKKAVCAVAASMLTAIWHMLRDGTLYQDLGADHFHRRSPEQQAQYLARQIAKLGFACTITPQPELVSA
jgi:transposase